MTNYLNPSTRSGGVEQIVVPERQVAVPVDDAPFDDEQYVRVNGEWVPYNAPPIIPDTLAPKPPTGLGATGTMAPNGTRVDYALEWDAPTQNTDNSPLTDFAYYVVRWRYGTGGVYQAFTTTDTSFLLTGLVPATDVEWAVLARDTSGNDSTWASYTIPGLADSTAPNQPSLPQLGSRLGSIVAAWDGLDFSAGAPPTDFDHLGVFMSATTGGPWEPIGDLNGAGVVVVAGIPVGETRFITFIAYDTSGNASTRSGESSIVVLGVTGPDIEANAITANMISAGELAAAITITGFLLAGDPTGSRVVIDGEGVRQYSAAGDIRINLPTDPDVPAQFEGNAIMDSLTVNDFLAIRGINNEISKGGVLALSSGTTAPSSAPSIAVDYAKYTSPRHEASYLFAPTGHCASLDNSEDFYATYSFYGYAQMYGLGGKKYSFPERTDNAGYKRSNYNFDSSTVIAIGGADRVVTVGNRTLNNGDTPAGYLAIWDPAPMVTGGTVSPTLKVGMSITSDNYVWTTRVGRGYGSGTVWANRFCMGIYQALVPQFTLKLYSTTDLAFTQVGADLVVTSPLASGESYMGVTWGDSAKMGFPGAAQSIWLIHGSVNTYAYNGAGTRLPQFDFPSPSGQAYMCAWGDPATNAFLGFRTTEWKSNSKITQLTNNHWDSTSTSSKWWVSGTWYDSDATGGTHETAQSARASITMPKRAGLTYTVPTYPARPFPTTTDDVIAARVYLSRGNADPGRTYMERIDTLSSPTRTGYVGNFTFPAGLAASPPPATSNFPASAPAKVQSSDGVAWWLQGDGYAQLGTFEVGLNAGTMLRKAIELSVGDELSTTQRFFKVLRKIGADAYQAARVIDNAALGFCDIIYKNAAELARLTFTNLGVLNITSTPSGTADYQVQGVSIGRGVLPGGYDQLTTTSATTVAVGTPTDIVELAITVNVPAGRRIKLSALVHCRSSVANDRALLYIREGSTTLGFAQGPTMTVASSAYAIFDATIIEPSAGSHTYVVSIARLAGTGTISTSGATTGPAYIMAEDISAAGT